MTRWVQPPLQTKVDYRDGDTIIAVPAKSGTTWLMNIYHQLKTGGDSDFEDIHVEIPWVEFKERPDQTDEELVERWNAMPTDVPRAFKTHSQPGDPSKGNFATFREDMKYLILVRNPEEAIVSLYPFFRSHSREFVELWDATEVWDSWLMNKPDFKSFFYESVLNGLPNMPPEMVPPGGVLTIVYFSFVNGWWPYRHKPNVLMMHFNDLKQDHEGSVKKIASHLGFTPTEQEFSNIMEYTSFKWMKDHQTKFEITKLLGGGAFPMIDPGGMVRKGQVGKAKEDGMTEDISKVIHEFAEKMVIDDAARTWMFNGGPL